MNPFYRTELKEIRQHLTLMGEKAMDIVHLAIQSLIEEEPAIADKVLEMDDEIDQLEVLIDSESIRYLTLRAPVASDVRLLTVAMRASSELERIGDEASSIAKKTKILCAGKPPSSLVDIPRMAEVVIEQLRDSLDSFIGENTEKAYAVPKKDIVVDDYNRQNRLDLGKLVSEDPSSAQQMIELVLVSKSLERIADHATNIAEEVIYMLDGEDIRHTEAAKRAQP